MVEQFMLMRVANWLYMNIVNTMEDLSFYQNHTTVFVQEINQKNYFFLSIIQHYLGEMFYTETWKEHIPMKAVRNSASCFFQTYFQVWHHMRINCHWSHQSPHEPATVAADTDLIAILCRPDYIHCYMLSKTLSVSPGQTTNMSVVLVGQGLGTVNCRISFCWFSRWCVLPGIIAHITGDSTGISLSMQQSQLYPYLLSKTMLKWSLFLLHPKGKHKWLLMRLSLKQ